MNPLELVDYLVAGAALLIGIGIGRRLRPRAWRPRGPVCSCRHGYGFHEAGRACRAEVQRPAPATPFGSAPTWEWVPCRCQRYDGPDPTIFGLSKGP